MNPLTIEWVTKAEGDFHTAVRELRARKSPNFDAVCFHSQQCAEKYLKAILQENEKQIPKNHNLIALLELCLVVDSTLELMRTDLIVLERYAVRFRYPGVTSDKGEARNATSSVKVFRKFIRPKLGLKG